MRYSEGKQLGVVASKDLEFGEFVVEYTGELIDVEEAEERERAYSADETIGCYMFFFDYKNTKYW